jgi:hypothetical protein
MNTQPESLRLAEILEGDYCPDWFYEQGVDEVAAELRRQHARIAELESELEAIGAGGVSGPLVGQPQAMPDLSQLTEREPVAIRPDIQAVLAMLDVPVIARMSSHEGKLLKPGQEPPAFESAVPLVREWDHRRACESIIAALSRNK